MTNFVIEGYSDVLLHTQGSTMIEKAKSELTRFKLEGKPCPCVGKWNYFTLFFPSKVHSPLCKIIPLTEYEFYTETETALGFSL